MNLNSREIRGLNIKSSFNRHCCRCCLNCCLQLGQQASTCTFDDLFGCPAYVWGFVYRLSNHFSAVHLMSVQGTPVSYLNYLSFESIKTYREPKLSCLLPTFQRRYPRALEVFQFYFALTETKRDETTCKQILHQNIHATRG